MKKVKINADLSIVSEQHQISLNSNDEVLEINIIGESAFFIPFKQLIKFYRLRTLTENISQKVIIKKNDKSLFQLNGGNLKIDNYSAAFRILIKSVFG